MCRRDHSNDEIGQSAITESDLEDCKRTVQSNIV